MFIVLKTLFFFHTIFWNSLIGDKAPNSIGVRIYIMDDIIGLLTVLSDADPSAIYPPHIT